MKHSAAFFVSVVATSLFAGGEPASQVNVFIGTSGLGHVTPAAAYPFGMIQAGPDTSAFADHYVADWPHTSGYQHPETNLFRFSQQHINGTGCPSLGNLGLLPYVAEPTDGVYSAVIDKRSERGEPGWYAVCAGGVDCEMVALGHSASYRFRYPQGASSLLLFDADWGVAGVAERDHIAIGGNWTRQCEVEFVSPTRCTGHISVNSWAPYELYWTMEFSRSVLAKRKVRAAGNGRGETWSLDFGTAGIFPLEVRIALSLNSRDAASRNLAEEMPRFGFDEYRLRARMAWNEVLGVLDLDPFNPDVAQSFMSALYRTMLQPNNIADVGEEPFYSTLSLWDTYRAAHPLYTLTCPNRVDGFVNSMLRQYRRQGFLPIWALMGRDTHCMVGHHSVPVIVDAYLKGFRGFDAEAAYAAVKDSLTRKHRADSTSGWSLVKDDWTEYDRYGYLPFDGMGVAEDGRKIVGESVSRTLECAYDDACAARFAMALGKFEDAKFFMKRSGFWRNVLDPKTGFVRGRKRDGSWRTPFNPFEIGHSWWEECDFTEGNAWQWTFHVMHDPEGLVAALGGKAEFGKKLDGLFSASARTECAKGVENLDVSGLIGQYAHGNEPSHHTAYFYRWSDRPARTEELVREICRSQYSARPDGLCGNDDCGQMAAWYIFSSLGFYPFDPCGGSFVLGAPQVPGATLHLSNGKTLVIKAKNFSDRNVHVKSVSWNGRPLRGYIIRYELLKLGGTIVFEMCN